MKSCHIIAMINYLTDSDLHISVSKNIQFKNCIISSQFYAMTIEAVSSTDKIL